MKRPMSLIGFVYLGALVAAAYFGTKVALFGAGVAFVIFIGSLFVKDLRRRRTVPTAMLVLCLALCVFSFFSLKVVAPISTLDGQDAQFTGRICDLSHESHGRYYYTVETNYIDISGPQKFKVRLSLSKALDADLYDEISGRMHLFSPQTGSSSSKNYYAAKGIHIMAYLYEYEPYEIRETTKKPLNYYFLRTRQTLTESLRVLLPERHSGLAAGILLGDKYMLDEEISSNFRRAGVFHLLSVSGLHVAVIGQFIMALFILLKINKRGAAVLSCVGIFIFLALIGFAPPAMRAGLMMILYFMGFVFNKQSDSLNSLGFATFCLAATNPFSGGDIGLLLSCAATLGMVLFSSSLTAFFKKFLQRSKFYPHLLLKLASPVAVSLAATLFTTPIIMLFFGQFSAIGVISNLFVVFPSTLAMLFVMLAAVLSMLGPLSFLAWPFALASTALIEYIIRASGLFASLPFSTISVSQPFVKFALASACVLVALALFFGKNFSLVRFACVLSCIIFFVGALSFQILERGKTCLAILDTGDGTSAVLTKSGHAAVLSCGGDKYSSSAISRYLEAQDILDIDIFALCEYTDQTALYAQGLAKQYSPRQVLLPKSDELDDKLAHTISDGKSTSFFKREAVVNFWGNSQLVTKNFGEKGYHSLTVDGIRVLISPSGISAAKIASQDRHNAIFVTSGATENLEQLSALYAAMASGLDFAKNYTQSLVKARMRPIATAGDGGILMKFSPGAHLSIGRMM